MAVHSRSGLHPAPDTERRPLRPIGVTVHVVAARTGVLLGGLCGGPGVRMYRDVRLCGQGLPPIPYALSAGCRVVLVEAVAWPPGRYATAPCGAVLCGDTYIGQSVHPLVGAVRRLRRLLPATHRVTAVVVVHPSAAGPLTLPGQSGGAIAWAHPGDAVSAVGRRLRCGPRTVGLRTAAALAAAGTLMSY